MELFHVNIMQVQKRNSKYKWWSIHNTGNSLCMMLLLLSKVKTAQHLYEEV
jgi:hypothetical protein